MVLEMIMESVFAIVDIFFVSKLGADAVATVGLTESVTTIIYAIGFGFATATTSLISRRIGEKKPEKASLTAVQAIIAGIVISIVIAIPGALYAKDILRAMGANNIIITEMSGYASITFGTNTVIMLLFIINSVFRSSGDPATAMKVLWLGNILNIILDPCFIFGWGFFPEMGVKGAAVATAIGRGSAVLWQFIILFTGHKRVTLKLRYFLPDFSILGKLFKLAIGGIGQNLIATISWVAMVRIVSVFGSVVVAGYTIAIRIVNFVLFPAWGISNASSTLVGQNLGADRPERAEKAAIKTAIVNAFLMAVITLVVFLWPGPLIRFFIKDPAVISTGIQPLLIISSGFIVYGIGMVMLGAINGAGDTITPTKIYFIAYWLVEMPLAWLLAVPLGLRQEGVYYSILFSETLMTIIAWIIFRRGKWKLKKV
jgi:putative MATE family efflux protein